MKIDRQVPIPKTSTGRKRKWPWFDMKKGDSFLMYTEYTVRNLQNASAQGIMFSKTNKKGKWKFSVRKTEEGIRVWRIK